MDKTLSISDIYEMELILCSVGVRTRRCVQRRYSKYHPDPSLSFPHPTQVSSIFTSQLQWSTRKQCSQSKLSFPFHDPTCPLAALDKSWAPAPGVHQQCSKPFRGTAVPRDSQIQKKPQGGEGYPPGGMTLAVSLMGSLPSQAFQDQWPPPSRRDRVSFCRGPGGAWEGFAGPEPLSWVWLDFLCFTLERSDFISLIS